MKCENCQTENNENRKYCLECGHRMGWQCICTFLNEPEAKYCGNCGMQKQDTDSTNKSLFNQLTKSQIDKLINEKILVNIGEDEEITQDDIDKIF